MQEQWHSLQSVWENTVLNILNGKDYEKEIKENVFMINQENVDMYGVDGWQ